MKIIIYSLLGTLIIFIVSFQQASAYAIGSTTNTGTNTYNFSDSMQTLISPFSGFIKNLQWTNNTTIDIHTTNRTIAPVNVLPGLENILRQWFSGFDDWFYGLTNIRLSGIIFVILNVLLWTLNVANAIVSWLLGLFK